MTLPLIIPRDVWENILSRYLDYFIDLPKLKTIFPELNFRRKPRLRTLISHEHYILRYTKIYLDSYLLEIKTYYENQENKIKSHTYFTYINPKGLAFSEQMISVMKIWYESGRLKSISQSNLNADYTRSYFQNGVVDSDIGESFGKELYNQNGNIHTVVRNADLDEKTYTYDDGIITSAYGKHSIRFDNRFHVATGNRVRDSWTYDPISEIETLIKGDHEYIISRRRKSFSNKQSFGNNQSIVYTYRADFANQVPFYSKLDRLEVKEDLLICIIEYQDGQRHGIQLIKNRWVCYGENINGKKEGAWRYFWKGKMLKVKSFSEGIEVNTYDLNTQGEKDKVDSLTAYWIEYDQNNKNYREYYELAVRLGRQKLSANILQI